MQSGKTLTDLPDFDPEDWVPDLRTMDLPNWGNVDGTLSGRVRKMDLDDIVEDYFSEDDTIVEVGCASGYTSTEIANISGANVVGIDVPEAYAGGVSENKYGDGPKPGYFSGVAPELPFQEDSVDGIAALNSVTYLARSLGSVAADRHEDVSTQDREKIEDFYTQSVVRDVLGDFERVTKEGGYVLLGEQSDSSYLLLEKEEEGWTAEGYGSFPDHDGENIHTRYKPWIRDENVSF